MYDLEIMIPTELKNIRIIQRFKDFRRWGLLNTNGTKIKLCFVASNDNDPEDLQALCDSWPKNIHAEYIITPHKHVAQRIMYYYNNAMKPDVARWYVRIDEDSTTDVAGLLKEIDKWFDYQREYYVIAECSKEVQDAEYKILTSMGFDWFDQVTGYDISMAPIHEIEISITSNAAVKRILANKTCREFLSIREQFCDGQGDHAFGFAARMEKIYQISAPFLTRNPKAIEFSIYGGKYFHIHDISRDRHGEYINWLEATEGFTTPELAKEIINRNFFFNWGNERIWVGFEESGRVHRNYQRCMPEWAHQKEPFGIWGFTKEGNLTLFITNEFYNNNPLNIFKKDGKNYLCKDKSLVLTNIEYKQVKMI